MNLETLAQKCLPHVPDCPRFIIVRALREAAIEMCEVSDIWQAEVEDLLTVDGVADYDLSPPTGANINHVLAILRTSGTSRFPLRKVTQEAILSSTSSGPPQVYTLNDSDTITFSPVPDAASVETLKVLYSLKPSNTATSIPDFVAKENEDALMYGATYRLLSMPQVSWTNPPVAAEHYRRWRSALGRVVRKVKYGHAGAPLTVQNPGFG